MATQTTWLVTFAILTTFVCLALGAKTFTITVETKTSHHTTDKYYLSVAFGGNMCERLDAFKVNDATLRKLALAFGPSVARIGGMAGNFNIINQGSKTVTEEEKRAWKKMFKKGFWKPVGKGDWSNINCTAEDTATLFKFFQDIGWPIKYQLNNMLRDEKDRWDPHNANILLRYLDDQSIDVDYLQLTNEPNSYYDNLMLEENVTKVVEDFKILDDYLATEAPSRYKDSIVVGPDTGIIYGGAKSFLWRVIEAGLGNYIGALGVHLYYVDGRTATTSDFINATIFDFGQTVMDNVWEAMHANSLDVPVYFSESASAYGGGAPDISNRYIGSLMWLDELGLGAKNRLDRINRQTFWAGKYALLEYRDYYPTPSYWISKAFKDLVEGPVMTVTQEPQDNRVRLYAHCANRNGPYSTSKGSMVVYGVNLMGKSAEISVNGLKDDEHEDFVFSRMTGGLSLEESFKSILMKLNGDVVEMDGDDLPELLPAPPTTGPIIIPKYGMVFSLFRKASVKLCRDHWD